MEFPTTHGTKKTRILFVAEAVTLAHVARPAALAAALDPDRYEVHFAHCPRYRALLGEPAFIEHDIESISPGLFAEALAAGRQLYDFDTLVAYVEQERRLLAEVEPDLVVGDLRLSLGVSAKLANIPHIALTNACWSPYAKQRYPVPELPMARAMGLSMGKCIFFMVRPFVFAAHCLPMWKLRRRYGLPSLGFDLRRVYTQADYTLYADVPGLYRMVKPPSNHRVIGPVVWSPDGVLPDWWNELPTGRPLVYATLGSSGQATLLPELLKALGSLEVTAMVSTAGAQLECPVPDNVFVAPYLPGDEAAKRASLVICNGGSPTTHQALTHGKPVIGVAGNLDQYLNMQTLVAAGAGVRLRSGLLTAEKLCMAVQQMLKDEGFRAAAGRLAATIEINSGPTNFRNFIDELAPFS